MKLFHSYKTVIQNMYRLIAGLIAKHNHTHVLNYGSTAWFNIPSGHSYYRGTCPIYQVILTLANMHTFVSNIQFLSMNGLRLTLQGYQHPQHVHVHVCSRHHYYLMDYCTHKSGERSSLYALQCIFKLLIIECHTTNIAVIWAFPTMYTLMSSGNVYNYTLHTSQ